MKGSLVIVSGLALLCAGAVLGQLEQCHTTILVPQHFLNLRDFSGVWYPLEVAPSKASQVEPLPYRCLSINLTQTSNIYELNAAQSYVALENGTAVGNRNVNSLIKLDDVSETRPPHNAIWNVYSPIPGTNLTDHSQSVIVAADEAEWAIQYSCGILNGELLERILIWSRNRTLDPIVQKTLDTVAYGIGFPRNRFQTIVQDQCN